MLVRPILYSLIQGLSLRKSQATHIFLTEIQHLPYTFLLSIIDVAFQ